MGCRFGSFRVFEATQSSGTSKSQKIMKKEIIEIDKEKGIFRCTTWDERFYAKSEINKNTGLPEYKFVPSVTWIAGCYPKGIGFYKWLAEKGWDEAEAIKQAAGDKGSKVHLAIEDMIRGKMVRMEDKYLNKTTNEEEDLTLEEYNCLMGFADWVKERKPKFIKSEFVIFDDSIGYAGTVDCLCEIDGKRYIVDFKTSQNIWPEYELQLSAYKHAIGDPNAEMMILQIGYRRNKHSWKENIVQDKFDLFLSAKKIWQNEHGEEKPSQKDYPLELSIPKELCIIDETEKPKEEAEEEKVVKTKRAAKKAVEING